MSQTSDAPVPFSTFTAEVRRLDAADASSTLRLESHIRDYRRERLRRVRLLHVRQLERQHG